MAVINHTRKWLYLMEPHTASRATEQALCRHQRGSKIGHHHISYDELIDSRRPHVNPKRVLKYDVICTVRNPLDVLVTKWEITNKTTPFIDWVLDNLEHPTLIHPLKGLYTSANLIVYYENLQEDLRHVFKGSVELELNPKHVTKEKRHWSEYYNGQDAMVEILLNKFHPFNDYFGYTFDYTDSELTVTIDEDRKSILTQPIRG